MVYVQTDVKDTISSLLADLEKKDIKRIAKKMIGRALTVIKREARKDVSGRVLKVKTGNLKKGFKSIVYRNGFDAVVKNVMPHAHLQEDGAHPVAKTKKYLTFQVNGRWVKVKSVTIPPRPFLYPHVQGFPNNELYQEMMKVMEKELKKLEEKGK